MEHGKSINEYYKCKEAKGVACRECKDAARDYQLAWRRANREYYREYKREERKRYYKKYPNKRTELNRKKGRKERARLRQLKSVSFTTKDVIDLWGTDCHICNESIDMRITRHCGELGWEMGLHLDHVIPLAKGGHNIISNVKPSHASCNLKKRDSLQATV